MESLYPCRLQNSLPASLLNTRLRCPRLLKCARAGAASLSTLQKPLRIHVFACRGPDCLMHLKIILHPLKQMRIPDRIGSPLSRIVCKKCRRADSECRKAVMGHALLPNRAVIHWSGRLQRACRAKRKIVVWHKADDQDHLPSSWSTVRSRRVRDVSLDTALGSLPSRPSELRDRCVRLPSL